MASRGGTLGALGGCLLAFGIFLVLAFNATSSACSSSLGFLAQGVSRAAATHCFVDGALDILGLVALAVGILLVTAAIVVTVMQPWQSLAPGWYPRRDGSLRWWDGRRWTRDKPPVPGPGSAS